MKIFFLNLFLITFICISISSSQEVLDDIDENEIDFAPPGESSDEKENANDCETSPHSELLNLLNVKLKKFNPILKKMTIHKEIK